MSNMISIQGEHGPISINPDRIATVTPAEGDTTMITLDSGESFKVEKPFSKVVQQINSARAQ